MWRRTAGDGPDASGVESPRAKRAVGSNGESGSGAALCGGSVQLLQPPTLTVYAEELHDGSSITNRHAPALKGPASLGREEVGSDAEISEEPTAGIEVCTHECNRRAEPRRSPTTLVSLGERNQVRDRHWIRYRPERIVHVRCDHDPVGWAQSRKPHVRARRAETTAVHNREQSSHHRPGHGPHLLETPSTHAPNSNWTDLSNSARSPCSTTAAKAEGVAK